MATTRPSKLPTNLKDRIAALEQRTTTTSPPTSPTPSTAPTAYVAQSVGTLKDKIARFERKGGVPVPRGSFGLGAPPAADGPKRQGELYGNRIQAQYTGGSLASVGSYTSAPQRRSFSASVLTGNFDDNYLDSAPNSPPPSVPPLDSPSNSPEPSPSRIMNGDIPVVRRNAARGTSFHEALEFARKVEAAKREALMPQTRKKSTDFADAEEKLIEDSSAVQVSNPESEDVGLLLEPTPAILISSDDPVAYEVSSSVVAEAPLEAPVLTEAVVEPLASEAVEVKLSAPEGPETKRDLKSATTVRSENQLVAKAEPVNIDVDTSSLVAQVTAPSSTSTTRVGQPTKRALPVPPSIKHLQTRETESKLTESDSTSVQTPQIVVNHAPVKAVGNIDSKHNVSGSNLPDDRKGILVDTENVVTLSAPKDAASWNKTAPGEVSAPADKAEEQPPKVRSQIPVARVKPTIQPPDSSAFLSPPPSGFRSAQLSSGISSLSSLSSRPLSMIEVSPSEVSRALKMTPATGRGIPVFLPPSNSQTRKSDFVFLPPSPGNANVAPGRDVEGSLGHHKAGSESDLTSNSFKSVVHEKVKEAPVSATLPVRKQFSPEDLKRATILQTPLSPGHGELATLLQEAMLLEDTLNKGELPEESPADDAEAGGDTKKPLYAGKSKDEERQRIVTAQLRSKRDLPTHGRLKHTFLMPLSKARAAQKQEISTPTEQAIPRSSREDSRPKAAVSDPVGANQVAHEKASSTGSPQSPSKIPKLSKFPSFKRFGSISRTVTQQEAFMRHTNSMSSEISSDDSNLIVTPPDNAPMEFGERRPSAKDADQQSAHSQTLSFSFPSLSPKKSGSIGRAASFAEKIWSRARTKSNGSVLSSSGTTHRSTEELTPQLPVLSELPLIPTLGSIVPPVYKEPSTLRYPMFTSPPSTAPPISSMPTSSAANQPFSPMSLSSIGSLPSPLFDKDICDAFPSVPTDTPAQLPHLHLTRSRGQGLTPAATGVSADFDSALLSSAIHLAARSKASASSDYAVPPASAR